MSLHQESQACKMVTDTVRHSSKVAFHDRQGLDNSCEIESAKTWLCSHFHLLYSFHSFLGVWQQQSRMIVVVYVFGCSHPRSGVGQSPLPFPCKMKRTWDSQSVFHRNVRQDNGRALLEMLDHLRKGSRSAEVTASCLNKVHVVQQAPGSIPALRICKVSETCVMSFMCQWSPNTLTQQLNTIDAGTNMT